MSEMLAVELVWREGPRVRIESLELPAGSVVADALRLWGGVAQPGQVGVFGRVASWEQVLQAGDRVEIYEPLPNDPKAARRERARLARQR